MADHGNTAATDSIDAPSQFEPYAGDIALTPDGLRYLGMIPRAPHAVLPPLGCNSLSEIDPEQHAVA